MVRVTILATSLILLLPVVASAGDPVAACIARLDNATGRYAACLFRSKAVYTKRANEAQLDRHVDRCDRRFARVVRRAERHFGLANCPSEGPALIRAAVDQLAGVVHGAMASGLGLEVCADGATVDLVGGRCGTTATDPDSLAEALNARVGATGGGLILRGTEYCGSVSDCAQYELGGPTHHQPGESVGLATTLWDRTKNHFCQHGPTGKYACLCESPPTDDCMNAFKHKLGVPLGCDLLTTYENFIPEGSLDPRIDHAKAGDCQYILDAGAATYVDNSMSAALYEVYPTEKPGGASSHDGEVWLALYPDPGLAHCYWPTDAGGNGCANGPNTLKGNPIAFIVPEGGGDPEPTWSAARDCETTVPAVTPGTWETEGTNFCAFENLKDMVATYNLNFTYPQGSANNASNQISYAYGPQDVKAIVYVVRPSADTGGESEADQRSNGQELGCRVQKAATSLSPPVDLTILELQVKTQVATDGYLFTVPQPTFDCSSSE